MTAFLKELLKSLPMIRATADARKYRQGIEAGTGIDKEWGDGTEGELESSRKFDLDKFCHDVKD